MLVMVLVPMNNVNGVADDVGADDEQLQQCKQVCGGLLLLIV